LRATDRLHRLVEGLLDFGRMEAGASVYRFELLDAAALTGAVVEEFQRETESRGYRVEFTTNGGEAQVSADRESLTRAIWNLLDNAEKYSPGCRTVWVEMAREDRQVAIRVRDRGLGIPPQEQQEIFRKFVRGSSSKGVQVKGTGIGLAMVRHIVQAHGGSLRLESRPGEGSTFTILLPAGG
jgi:signal transduction histidine kinase